MLMPIQFPINRWKKEADPERGVRGKVPNKKTIARVKSNKSQKASRKLNRA